MSASHRVWGSAPLARGVEHAIRLGEPADRDVFVDTLVIGLRPRAAPMG
ncbi:hypothetical protein [Nocardiopsis alba]